MPLLDRLNYLHESVSDITAFIAKNHSRPISCPPSKEPLQVECAPTRASPPSVLALCCIACYARAPNTFLIPNLLNERIFCSLHRAKRLLITFRVFF